MEDIVKTKQVDSFANNERGFLGFIKFLNEKRIFSLTASWVFYFVLSIIPLAFLLITAFSLFGVDLSLELAGRLPEEFREAVEVIVGTAANVSNSVTFLFIITVILSCSSLLNQMSKDGDYIYGKTHKRRRGIFRRAWVFIMLCGLFLLFTAFALLFSFREIVLMKLGANLKNIVTIISFVVIMLFGYSVILLLNKFISPIKLKAGAWAFSSFISLAIVVLGTIGLILYIRFFSNYNAFYGSLAGVLAFFMWAYVLMFGIIFGVFTCVRLNCDKIE